MPAYEYEVTRDIAEIGARVWDVLVWRWPDVFLYRETRTGEILMRYPGHWTFLLLKYQDHLRPLHQRCPAPLHLARIALGSSAWPAPESGAPHLRLVE